jgi:hypothetical protein
VSAGWELRKSMILGRILNRNTVGGGGGGSISSFFLSETEDCY